jgi:hypothetical protein
LWNPEGAASVAACIYEYGPGPIVGIFDLSFFPAPFTEACFAGCREPPEILTRTFTALMNFVRLSIL